MKVWPPWEGLGCWENHLLGQRIVSCCHKNVFSPFHDVLGTVSTEHFLKSKVSQASSYPFVDDKYFTWKQWERNIGGKCPSVSKQIVLVSVSSVQSVSRVWLSATPWTAARQASLSITSSQSWLKPMSIESVMPSNISSSAIPFSSHLQSFPESGSFPISPCLERTIFVLYASVENQETNKQDGRRNMSQWVYTIFAKDRKTGMKSLAWWWLGIAHRDPSVG